MIILYLIALIFILLLVIVNKKDFFSNQCDYVPWGPSYDFCVDNCKSKNRIGLWDLTGNFCNEDICQEKCIKCDNERCEWLSMWDRTELNKKLNQGEINTYENSLAPKKITINGRYWNSKYKLYWNKNPNPEIKKYMIHIYDLTNPNDKVKIISLDSNDTKYVQEGNEISYSLDELKANINYSLIMYSLNKYGISPPSNIINIKT